MARITLYADKMNQMFGLIEDVKKSVIDYNSELFSLKTNLLSINKSVCNMDDIISSIQASSQTQERKIASLDTLSNNVKQFVEDVVRIDREVADHIRKSKEEFYAEHENLRPECEKHGWEKFKDGFKAAGEWCREHWKLMATTGIVILAVILICTGVGGILGATMAVGALLGTAIGGTVGGVISTLTGGSFWEGFENGAFSGAIAGIISGGMGAAMSTTGTVALSLWQTMSIGVASGAGVSLVGDLGDKFIKGVDISWRKMFSNMAISGLIGGAFAGIGYGITKGLGGLFKNSFWFSKGKELFKIGKTSNPNYGRITSYTTQNPKGVSFNIANSGGKTIFRMEFDIKNYLHYHIPSLFGSKSHMPLSPIIDSIISRNVSNVVNKRFEFEPK